MTQKLCPTCQLMKPVEEFALSGGKRVYCRPCKQAYDRAYWKKTAPKRRSSKKVNSSAIRDRNTEFVFSFLQSKSCTDCGENDPLVLEFDHRDPELKTNNVSQMVSSCFSIEKLTEEIDKCDVVCSNCHRRRTAHQFGFRRAMLLKLNNGL